MLQNIKNADGDETKALDGTDGHLNCLLFLCEAGGMKELWEDVVRRPSNLEDSQMHGDSLRFLLSDPRLLNLAAKQAWLQWRLGQLIDESDAVALQLVASRERCCVSLPLPRIVVQKF
jgi:hypothetical protein